MLKTVLQAHKLGVVLHTCDISTQEKSRRPARVIEQPAKVTQGDPAFCF